MILLWLKYAPEGSVHYISLGRLHFLRHLSNNKVLWKRYVDVIVKEVTEEFVKLDFKCRKVLLDIDFMILVKAISYRSLFICVSNHAN